MIEFEEINIKHRNKYEDFLKKSGIISSEYSFLGLWAWREPENTRIFFDENICWLKNRRGVLSPICDPEQNWEKIIYDCFPEGVILNDVPESLTFRLSSLFGAQIKELRSEWEYIYSINNLIELKGRSYSQKRGHVKVFEEKYNGTFVSLLEEDFTELREFQSEWLRRFRGGTISSTVLNEENEAIMNVFENWNDFPLFGAYIRVDGHIAAYTIAEELNHDTIDIRFEKAFSEYEGIYQFLNKTFLSKQAKNYTWVNREEDVGDEGLRKAKLSYHPTRFEKKYMVSIPKKK